VTPPLGKEEPEPAPAASLTPPLGKEAASVAVPGLDLDVGTGLGLPFDELDLLDPNKRKKSKAYTHF